MSATAASTCEAVLAAGLDVDAARDAQVIADLEWLFAAPAVELSVCSHARPTETVDPALLPIEERVTLLVAVEHESARVAARRLRSVVACAGPVFCGDTMRERQVAMEIALALRIGESAATSLVVLARALHSDYPQFLDALEVGEVSEWHCRELVTGTRHVTEPDVLAALGDLLLPKARRKTPGEFRRDVRVAVARLDAEREAERRVAARRDRYVAYRALDDGLGYVGVVTDQPTARAMYDAITSAGTALQAERGGASAVRAGDNDATADACRADAMAALVLGRHDADGSVCWDRSQAQVSLTVVVDLDTLRREADRPGLLDGEPVPASLAREVASIATMWRRAVTDPVTGHLLDYGTQQYLPARLRDYVLARDLCRVPGCTARAQSRLEMDHAVPFPEGSTSAGNCGGLCRRHHQLKTERLADVVDSKPDGSATWVTALGQTVRIPPRPFLHDPTDDEAHDVGPPPPANRPDTSPEAPPF